MGFVFQTPETVGGTVLIIERIESQNYVAGVSGWAIFADGDSEFADVTARGELATGPPGTERVVISNAPGKRIAFETGEPLETAPGSIDVDYDTANDIGFLTILGPSIGGAPQPGIVMQSSGSTFENDMLIDAQHLHFSIIDATASAPIDLDGVWFGFTSNGVWSGTWTDAAGARAGYTKDITQRVQLRGLAIGGGTAQIGVLPVGYRPAQSMEWIMRGGGGVILCAVSVTTAGVITATANVGTAQASGVRLDSISFPVIVPVI